MAAGGKSQVAYIVSEKCQYIIIEVPQLGYGEERASAAEEKKRGLLEAQLEQLKVELEALRECLQGARKEAQSDLTAEKKLKDDKKGKEEGEVREEREGTEPDTQMRGDKERTADGAQEALEQEARQSEQEQGKLGEAEERKEEERRTAKQEQDQEHEQEEEGLVRDEGDKQERQEEYLQQKAGRGRRLRRKKGGEDAVTRREAAPEEGRGKGQEEAGQEQKGRAERAAGGREEPGGDPGGTSRKRHRWMGAVAAFLLAGMGCVGLKAGKKDASPKTAGAESYRQRLQEEFVRVKANQEMVAKYKAWTEGKQRLARQDQSKNLNMEEQGRRQAGKSARQKKERKKA